MEHPRLKAGVSFAKTDADTLLVRAPGSFLRYQAEGLGDAFARLASHLDGARTIDEAARAAGVPTEDAREMVEALRADRLLDEGPAVGGAHGGFLSHLTADPAAALARVHGARVAVLGAGDVARAAHAALAAAGVTRIQPDLAGADHALVLADAPDPQLFLRANDASLASSLDWTGAFLDGLEATVGPTVIPGQTACWRCYDLRAKGAHPHMDRALAFDAARPAPAAPAHLPGAATVVGAWAAQAAVLAIGRVVAPPLADAVVRVDLLAMRSTRHRVLRIPRCPACSRAPIPDVDRYAP